MNKKQLVLDVINSIRKKNGLAELNEWQSETNLRDDLGLSSLELAELTVKIEAKTGIDIFASGLIYTTGEILEKLN
jgi:acyl carrier protein